MRLTSKHINYTVATVDDLLSLAGEEDTTVVVTEEGRGGLFIYRGANSAINNDGTIFNGWTRDYSGAVNVKWFGAKSTLESGYETFDSSDSIINALAYYDSVVINTGEYRCDKTIVIEGSKTVKLSSNTTVIRKSNLDSSPVFIVRGSYSSLIGESMSNSNIISENDTTSGVVCIGDVDLATGVVSTTYCTVKNLNIVGSTVNGSLTNPNVGIYLGGGEVIQNYVNYFNEISSIVIRDVNYGILLDGYANANIVTNIQGQRIGNLSSGHNAMIWVNGAIDNVFKGAFFHHSTDSIMIKVTELYNPVTDRTYKPYANHFSGYVAEQGGTGAKSIWSDFVSGSSYYEIRSNVAGGSYVPTGWYDNNTYINGPLRNSRISIDTDSTSNNSFLKVNKNGIIVGRDTVDDGYSDNQIEGSFRTGNCSNKSITSNTGVFTFVINHKKPLNGDIYRQASAEIFVTGCTTGGDSLESKYLLTFRGNDTFDMRTPQKITGSDLTITSVDTDNSNTITVDTGVSGILGAIDIRTLGYEITWIS